MRDWQAKLGFFGAVIWIASFSLYSYLIKVNFPEISTLVGGYSIGFFVAFAGHIFWEYIVKWDKLDKIVDEIPGLNLISWIIIVLALIMGFAGFVKSVFFSNSWIFYFGSTLGVLVINQGILPIIEYIDGRK